MIKFHPHEAQLKAFAEGVLRPAESIILSAHADMCEECREKLDSYTSQLAHELFDDLEACGDNLSQGVVSRDFAVMFESITSESKESGNAFSRYECVDSHIKGSNHEPNVSHHLDNMTRSQELSFVMNAEQASIQSQFDSLELDSRKFNLPPTLRRLLNRTGDWSHMVGKLWQCPVSIGGGYLAQFIYMETNGGVPEHTHKGNEFTLVINGSFEDEMESYNTGDFVLMDNSKTHTPLSKAHEGCLVFSIIDQPLSFTSGWARLINPLSNIYFKVNSQ